MNTNGILNIETLTLPWKSQDPFIFCSYHSDLFPGGNNELGPNTSLKGRNIGQDFSGKDGWSMYHGEKVPGFPAHPHSGFETVTIVTKGMTDHSDSLGAHGRFGEGDVQWLTAGKGVQHSEMFPLLNKEENPFEIFQLWLNLPKKNKNVPPYYQMLWKEDIPILNILDEKNRITKLHLIAGSLNEQKALPPNPDSWASDPKNEVQIWLFQMEVQASFTIPSLKKSVNRTLYFYNGDTIEINEQQIHSNQLIELESQMQILIKNGNKKGFFLLLQGKPINEPIIQYGPFVANSKEGLNETIQNYRETKFGGWPWKSSSPTHGNTPIRFSVDPNGNKTLK